MNNRISKKDKALIKGSMRRIFARSEYHRRIKDSAYVEHSDPTRKRVKSWRRCQVCTKPEAKTNCVLDHLLPVVPINSSLEEMSIQEIADAIWCDEENLQVVCSACHFQKTLRENAQRRKYKKENK